LLGDGSTPYRSESGSIDTLASVLWFVIGISWKWVDNTGFRSRQGYRDLPMDEDAQILRFEDEE
jgi:hypothetical protein